MSAHETFHFQTLEEVRGRIAELGLDLPLSEDLRPLQEPLQVGSFRLPNRLIVQPMEGCDGLPDGSPDELTFRRYRRFAAGGAGLLWFEATAVTEEARANPRQIWIREQTLPAFARLVEETHRVARENLGPRHRPLLVLQLTHSGRFSRPDPGQPMRPRIAYRHPLLDGRVGVTDDRPVFTDAELEGLVNDYVAAARFAAEAGFDFVDIKASHGYLLHEFLSAHTRPGPYGGSFENRTRLFREIVAAIRRDAPSLHIGVRVSIFDSVPFTHPKPGQGTRGTPADFRPYLPYRYGFGLDPDNPLEVDFSEPLAFLHLCRDLDVRLINITAACPYYNPHLMRPAYFPPSDGYPPPEDPLTGCARLIHVAGRCKRAVPDLAIVGTGYTYFQEYLPHVAQAQVRLGQVDFVGLGRMLLAYPDLPHDILTGKPIDRKRLCRTFSDCTTGPRNGMVSGCYPLDPYYKARPEAQVIQAIRRKAAPSAKF